MTYRVIARVQSERRFRRTEMRDAIPMPDCSVAAVVSDLKFGHVHALQGNPVAWYAETLREIERVVRPGGSAVLLMPDGSPARGAFERCDALKPDLSRTVEVLGQHTNLWCFARV